MDFFPSPVQRLRIRRSAHLLRHTPSCCSTLSTWTTSCFFLALQLNSGLGLLHETFRFSSVTRSNTAGRSPWTDDQLISKPLSVHKHRKTTHNTNTKHPCPEWESNPRSQKIFHVLDRSATVTAHGQPYHLLFVSHIDF
jgi:hypothetical protein